MLPSPNELRYLIEIAETGNLSRAAERLGITQPTLTVAVKRVEESFGLPILIRTKSGVELTKAGSKLVGQARFLLNEWEKIRTEAVRDDKELRGSYVLGCHPSVALFSLPSFLPRLLTENPALNITLVHELSRRVTENVISYRIDFGIVVNPWRHPDLVIRPLATDDVLLWTRTNPTELQSPKSQDAVLICDPELVQTQEIQRKFRKAGLSFRRVITTSNLEVVATLIASGAGVGILPTRVARRLPEMQLVPFMQGGPRYQDKIALIFRADATRSKASRAITQFIEGNFNPEPFAP